MDADKAALANFVARVVPAAALIGGAMKKATAIATMPSLATVANKEVVNAAVETGLNTGLCATDIRAEVMSAFVARRPGVWTGK